jgi:hypothetical protein
MVEAKGGLMAEGGLDSTNTRQLLSLRRDLNIHGVMLRPIQAISAT